MKRKDKRNYRKYIRPAAMIAVVSLLCGGLLPGCGSKNADSAGEAVQEDNQIAGFLFHFDQREETRKLVKFKNDGKMPVKAAWYFDPDAPDVVNTPAAARERIEEAETGTTEEGYARQTTEAETVQTTEEGHALQTTEAETVQTTEEGAALQTKEGKTVRTVKEGYALQTTEAEAVQTTEEGYALQTTEAEAVQITEEEHTLQTTEAASVQTTEEAEGVRSDEQGVYLHAPTGETTDPQKIIKIYNALNNVIIVGNVVNRGEGRGYYITFTLDDGSECRFDFPAEGLIRLSDHNYSIETDGSLWPGLK